ncbi:MAG: hypothetical protein KatS3mg124_1739 [Porticoccaceae bacterium]|nr:MAG: hypothetical protein KatS3mg124_1739 [Porticoccaceae bacterium]
MSRIPPLSPAQWPADLAEALGAAELSDLELGPLRIFAHHPPIARAVAGLAGALRASGRLSPRLKELLRLRIAFHNQCRSCLAIRYADAVAEGVGEELVCELADPAAAAELSAAEKAALAFADRFATDHLAIGDADYAELRLYFDEGELVELGTWVAFCVGFGRLAATWDMTELLPEGFREPSEGPVTPWAGRPVVVR